MFVNNVRRNFTAMLAVIMTGGKQYLVKKGDKIKVEKLDGNVGDAVTFDQVLFVGDDKAAKVGTPTVAKAAVPATILAHGRHGKVWGIKFNPKKRYKVKYGHKQQYTEVEIGAF